MRTGIHADISNSGFGVTMAFADNQDIKLPHLKRLRLAGFERQQLKPRHFIKPCTKEEMPDVLVQAERLNQWLADPENARERIYPKKKAA